MDLPHFAQVHLLLLLFQRELFHDRMSVREREQTKSAQRERRMTIINEVYDRMSVREQEQTKSAQCERRMT